MLGSGRRGFQNRNKNDESETIANTKERERETNRASVRE
jgi:hypothetical protein